MVLTEVKLTCSIPLPPGQGMSWDVAKVAMDAATASLESIVAIGSEYKGDGVKSLMIVVLEVHRLGKRNVDPFL